MLLAQLCSPLTQGRALGLLPVLCPITAPHRWCWGGTAALALAEPRWHPGLSCGMGATCPLTMLDVAPPSTLTMGAGSPPGNPNHGPQPMGAGTASSALPLLSSPPWLPGSGAAGRRAAPWQSCPLAELSLGRAAPWQSPTWPEGPSLEPDPARRSSAASSHRRQRWADPARCRTLARGPGRDTQRRDRAWGQWKHRESQSPPVQHSVNTCPHAHRPPGTQATAVTTVSFYSLHLYIHGIKPSFSTRLCHASPMTVATWHAGP